MNRLRSPIGVARGLGSAKDGTGHFWSQRITGLALVPLVIWFVAGLVGQVGGAHADFVDWIGRPVNTVLIVLTVVALMWHSMLGLQVVVEDYIHTGWAKLTVLITLSFTHIALGAAAVYAVLRIGLAA